MRSPRWYVIGMVGIAVVLALIGVARLQGWYTTQDTNGALREFAMAGSALITAWVLSAVSGSRRDR